MTILYTTQGFNPFFLDHNEKTYMVKKITVYTQYRKYTIDRGWFGSSNNQVRTLEIPDVCLRRKENLDGKTFIMVLPMNHIDKKYDKKHVNLYIPFEFFDFDIDTVENQYGFRIENIDRYTSKKIPKIYIFGNRYIKEDSKKKEEARRLLNQLLDYQTRIDSLTKEYDLLDPLGVLKNER